jgi:hypothetical protein
LFNGLKRQVKGIMVNLDGLGEGGKANLRASDIEYSVVLGQEGVAQENVLPTPPALMLPTQLVEPEETTPELKLGGEVLATKGKGYNGESGVTRETVEPFADGRGSILGTRNLSIERSDVLGIAVY